MIDVLILINNISQKNLISKTAISSILIAM